MHLKPGDKAEAYCEHCDAFEPTTMKIRKVPFNDDIGTVEGILVDVCDRCDRVVAVPAQSTPAIRAARERAIHPGEARD